MNVSGPVSLMDNYDEVPFLNSLKKYLTTLMTEDLYLMNLIKLEIKYMHLELYLATSTAKKNNY